VKVGQLEIEMLASMARLEKDMSKAKSLVGGSMKSIESAVKSAKSVLASLGIGLGVGYFVSLIKGSIDAMDHLHDLSKTTSISVEQLAGLKVAAKQSGTDLDGLAASINKLSQNMGKDAAKFAALGVSAKDPLEAFKQLSDVFVSLEDPQQRAAVMAAALGKSWAVAAPLLAEGGKRIGELVDEGTRLSGVTTKMAQDADRFNDNLVKLKTSVGGLVTALLGDLLPALTKIAEAFTRLTKGGALFENDQRPVIQAQINVLMGFYESALKSGQQSIAESYRKQIDVLIRKIQDENEKAKKTLGVTETPGKSVADIDPAKKKAAADAAAASLAEPYKPAEFNKLLADIEKATATSQMNIVEDEKEKSAMRIEIARAEMLAKVDFIKLTKYQKMRYMEAFEKFSIAKADEERKKSQGAMLDLIDTWQNTTKQLQDASAKWLQGTADALTDFVMTGKADFKSLADSIIRDLVRIFIQQKILGSFSTSTTAGTGLLGLVGSVLGFAEGGTHPGGARIVGENGPELEVTGPSRIYNAEQTKKMMGGNVYNIDARGADRQGLGRLESMIRRLDGSIERRSVSAVANDSARGGITAR
jgi:lambda family phage tail tape measure protein